MTDPLWDEFDQVERNNPTTTPTVAWSRPRPCAANDHDPVTVRTFGSIHVVTICTRCGMHLPPPDAN